MAHLRQRFCFQNLENMVQNNINLIWNYSRRTWEQQREVWNDRSFRGRDVSTILCNKGQGVENKPGTAQVCEAGKASSKNKISRQRRFGFLWSKKTVSQCWKTLNGDSLVFPKLYVFLHWFLSKLWPDDLDRRDAIFPSVDRLKLLSLSSLTDWISVSNCVASGATIVFILMSNSLDNVVLSSCWDCKLSPKSLADSAEMCASPNSRNCRVGVLFPSDIVNF